MNRGTVPKHWEWKKIGEIGSAENGYGFKKKYQGYTNKPIPFYKVSDMNLEGNETWMHKSKNYIDENMKEEMSVKKYPRGTIIFPKIGEAVRTNKKRILAHDSVFDNNVMGLVPAKDKIDSKYLYYYMLTVDLSKFIRETAVPSIRQADIEGVNIPFPSRKEQEKIVEKLDRIFERIDAIREAKEEAKKIEEELFSLTAESLINKVSRNRNNKILGNFIDVNPSYSHKDRDKYCMVPMKNVSAKKKDIVEFDTKESIYSGLSKFKEKDVIFARITPSTENGKLALVDRIPNDYDVCFGSTEFVVLHPRKDILPKYLYYLCRSRNFKTRAVASMKGSTGRKRVPFSFFREKVEVPIPDIKTQKEIVETLDLIKAKVNITHDTSRDIKARLELLPKTVLHKAFSGELC